ncbi:MAG: helix-turn-helix domain-containing protein [Nitratireductor sp.]|nr:helix-turn-helix domain-containing protein [Nitratireductor sp.]
MLVSLQSATIPVEQFRVELASVCGSFEVVGKQDRATVKGCVRLEEHAGIEMAHVAKDVHVVRRTEHDIRRDAGNHFFMIVQEEGHALMQQNGVAFMMKPGDMILIDSARPSEFAFFGNYSRQLSLHLPRCDVMERFGVAAVGGRNVRRSDYHAIAMNAILAKAFASGTNDKQTLYLKEAVYGLIGAILHEQSTGPERAGIDADVSRAQLLERGIAYLDRFFADHSITTQNVADVLGVSVRQVQRAFALAGTTPTDYLLKKRFEKACQMLGDRNAQENQPLISSIAYACGFNDVSYFNRQFRRLFGCAPGQYAEGQMPLKG